MTVPEKTKLDKAIDKMIAAKTANQKKAARDDIEDECIGGLPKDRTLLVQTMVSELVQAKDIELRKNISSTLSFVTPTSNNKDYELFSTAIKTLLQVAKTEEEDSDEYPCLADDIYNEAADLLYSARENEFLPKKGWTEIAQVIFDNMSPKKRIQKSQAFLLDELKNNMILRGPNKEEAYQLSLSAMSVFAEYRKTERDVLAGHDLERLKSHYDIMSNLMTYIVK